MLVSNQSKKMKFKIIELNKFFVGVQQLSRQILENDLEGRSTTHVAAPEEFTPKVKTMQMKCNIYALLPVYFKHRALD